MSNPFDLQQQPTIGLRTDLTNEQYHSGEGISKSGLDLIAHCPSSYLWNKQAPVDGAKTAALDLGTALHCKLLEPEEFAGRFIKAPKFNRRTNKGKEDEAEFLAGCEEKNQIILEHEDHRKLEIMGKSVDAHPTASWIMRQQGISEASIFWNHEHTGELCRIRPDRILTDHHIVIDVKKVAGMDHFERHAEEFRYHVQDAMYCEGYHAHFGVWPRFWFLVVDSTVGAGRYQVDVIELEQSWKDHGADLFHRDVATYHNCRVDDDWQHIRTISRPRWSRN